LSDSSNFLLQILLGEYVIKRWCDFPPQLFLVYTYLNFEELKTLKITHSVANKHILRNKQS